MIEWIALCSWSSGIGFFAAGSIGLLRLPDLHSRLHALTKADNLGLGLLAVGLALLDGGLLTAIKLLLVWLLVMAASAASAYLIAQQALRRGRRLMETVLWNLLDLALAGLLLGLGWAAVSSPDLKRGVVLFIAFGLLLAIVWARLRAPDLALAEAAIGAGLSGALLLSALRDDPERRSRHDDFADGPRRLADGSADPGAGRSVRLGAADGAVRRQIRDDWRTRWRRTWRTAA